MQQVDRLAEQSNESELVMLLDGLFILCRVYEMVVSAAHRRFFSPGENTEMTLVNTVLTHISFLDQVYEEKKFTIPLLYLRTYSCSVPPLAILFSGAICVCLRATIPRQLNSGLTLDERP
mmetsp:Transcript_30252/g.84541  ORF Transcript_30252/g.84541 Transcript_30252/m.84541 type:complete len:120 (+) Transcript_30252:385-744(+)